MQIDTFTITGIELANPPSLMTMYGFLVLAIPVAVVFLMTMPPGFLSKKSLRFRTVSVIVTALVFGCISAALIQYDKRTNPSLYSHYLMCNYKLSAPNETVEHSTRVYKTYNHTRCSDIGDRVVRIKTDTSVDYYKRFEIPN